MIRIDLISDTATRPGAAMRAAMAGAEVGDAQLGEDPCVNALEARVAGLLGKEAALFLPSGTMCNQIALAVAARPGDEILAAANAHVIGSEGAGAAVLAGAVIRDIPAPDGRFTAADLRAAIRPARVKAPRPAVLVVEQTSNRGGGTVWGLDALLDLSAVAREAGLWRHMDGARLMNAVVASGIPARDFAAEADSVWLDLSKGLGCPVGAVLAGPRGFIEEARRWQHRLGGAMRQAGVLASAGLHALEHNIARLADDHAHARAFAERLRGQPGLRLVTPMPETNIVFFDLAAGAITPDLLLSRLAGRGIRIGHEGGGRMRAVFHLDVDRAGMEEAAGVLAASL